MIQCKTKLKLDRCTESSYVLSTARRNSGDLRYGPTDDYSFTTSGAPTTGTCTVSPNPGRSMSTQFTVACSGFVDAQTLTYAVYLRDASGGAGKQNLL